MSFEDLEQEHYSRMQEEYERTPWERQQPGFYHQGDHDDYVSFDDAVDFALDYLDLKERIKNWLKDGELVSCFEDNGYFMLREGY